MVFLVSSFNKLKTCRCDRVGHLRDHSPLFRILSNLVHLVKRNLCLTLAASACVIPVRLMADSQQNTPGRVHMRIDDNWRFMPDTTGNSCGELIATWQVKHDPELRNLDGDRVDFNGAIAGPWHDANIRRRSSFATDLDSPGSKRNCTTPSRCHPVREETFTSRAWTTTA